MACFSAANELFNDKILKFITQWRYIGHRRKLNTEINEAIFNRNVGAYLVYLGGKYSEEESRVVNRINRFFTQVKICLKSERKTFVFKENIKGVIKPLSYLLGVW